MKLSHQWLDIIYSRASFVESLRFYEGTPPDNPDVIPLQDIKVNAFTSVGTGVISTIPHTSTNKINSIPTYFSNGYKFIAGSTQRNQLITGDLAIQNDILSSTGTGVQHITLTGLSHTEFYYIKKILISPTLDVIHILAGHSFSPLNSSTDHTLLPTRILTYNASISVTGHVSDLVLRSNVATSLLATVGSTLLNRVNNIYFSPIGDVIYLQAGSSIYTVNLSTYYDLRSYFTTNTLTVFKHKTYSILFSQDGSKLYTVEGGYSYGFGNDPTNLYDWEPIVLREYALTELFVYIGTEALVSEFVLYEEPLNAKQQSIHINEVSYQVFVSYFEAGLGNVNVVHNVDTAYQHDDSILIAEFTNLFYLNQTKGLLEKNYDNSVSKILWKREVNDVIKDIIKVEGTIDYYTLVTRGIRGKLKIQGTVSDIDDDFVGDFVINRRHILLEDQFSLREFYLTLKNIYVF